MHRETQDLIIKQVQKNKEPPAYWNDPEYHYLVYMVNRILEGLCYAKR